MAMDNRKGKADIKIGAASDTSKFGLTKVGLMDLRQAAAAGFDNRMGHRDISLGSMKNAGQHDQFNVGQLAMNNRKGLSNIKIGAASDTS